MRKWVISVVALCLIALALPLAASAGWAGSRYDKTECTYTKETRSLVCQSTFTVVEENRTDEFAIPDETCPLGTRSIRRTGTFTEPWIVFDFFSGGPVPHEKYHLGGIESPSGPGVWSNFTDTDLGCS